MSSEEAGKMLADEIDALKKACFSTFSEITADLAVIRILLTDQGFTTEESYDEMRKKMFRQVVEGAAEMAKRQKEGERKGPGKIFLPEDTQ